jgi:NADPH:quinone reductase-like Zn-dependent oxidoreductase
VLQTLKASSQKYVLVVDYVGNDQNLYRKAHEYTDPGAKFITIAVSHYLSFIRFIAMAHLLPRFLGGVKRQHLIIFGNGKAEDPKQLAGWMAKGKIRPVIDSKYKFEDLKPAYERAETGKVKSKIVINISLEDLTA